MPNWCENTIKIRHADPAMIDRVMNCEGLLMEFLPTPEDLNITAGFLGNDTPEQRELELKEAANLKKYGHKNWYDWNIANWGTKWDFTLENVERVDANTVSATFESAWAPPCDAYAKLVEQLGFSISGYYFEPGMAFAGIWEDGSDDYYEYGGMNSTQIAEFLPKELDEMFGISEQAAEWEAEQEEEEE